MLAVVVLCTEQKQHCIVPEKYILGLNDLQDKLKTWGVNNKHNHLVFWKRLFLDDNVAPNSGENPNFQLVPRMDFPPPPEIDSACYLARVKRFFSKYEYLVLLCSLYKRLFKSFSSNHNTFVNSM